ncbi:hypothetical protein [Marininema halotolerans]|uniref:Uncharacterized protein n=1 Tax=Marininema halotolerans TaxID=1155944 RepID=A0A1I6T8Z4_9BACL|nr:hypothetical protein [Marininema halotolerans]SFS85682.1 hypothetical protein SAMN05444972_10996 [Marininema halotolerans]
MLKRLFLIMTVITLVVTGTGCGLLDVASGKPTKKKVEEPKVAKLEFGDYDEDADHHLVNARGHFSRDEEIYFSFFNSGKKKLDSTVLKIRLLDGSKKRVIDEWNHGDINPSWPGLVTSWTDDDGFDGFTDSGKYTLQVLRGDTLLAEGSFEIVD